MKTRLTFLLAVTVAGLSAVSANATVLISPTGDGGFETGADFPTNGWTLVQGANNRLWVGTTAVASAGTNSAFSGLSAVSWTGEAFSNVNHFYRDIAFPAGETSISLTFKHKIAAPDGTFDYLKIWLVPTSTTPVAGTQLSSGQIGATAGYDSATTYTLVTITVPASAAGTTQRLVFSWRTDGVSPNAAVAVDEISLVSVAPVPISGTKTVGTGGDFATLTAAFAYLTANGVNGALVLELLPTYTSASETFPITAGNFPGNSGTNTITVRPQTGATGLSITSANTTATIDLNGAQNVSFDGRPGGTGTVKQLTIADTSTSGVAVRFINDAISDKLQYCTVTGVNTSTTSGVVLFSTTTGANGNDNNTIDNCDIRDGATTPTNGIYGLGTTTTTTLNNSGNTVSNNNIFNFFSASASSSGIKLEGGNTDWNITNNKFYQAVTRTQTTTSLQHSAIWLNNSTSGNNFLISGNTIGFATNTGTGTYTLVFPASTSGGFIPIFLSVGTTTATSVQGNTIAGIAMSGSNSGTSSSAPFRGIYVSSGLTTIGNVTGNTIGSQSATGSITYTTSSSSSSDVIGMFNFGSSNWTTSNNNIGGITAANSSTGASNIYGIRVNTSSSVTFTCQSNTIGGTVANSMQSTSTATGTIADGILNSAPAGTITGNTIRNLTAAGGTGTTTSASVAGIVSAASSANHTVSQNTIQTLTNTSSSSATTITGIQYTSSTGTNVVARNFIHSFSAASTTAVMNGIQVSGGTTTYKNNMIRLGVDASGNSVTTACLINGINELLNVSTSPVDNFYFNSVFIGGTGVGTTVSNTFAFNSLQTTATRAFQDNIFVNARSNATTGGKHYAVQVGGTTANPAGLTINFNVYNVTGTGGVFGRFNSLDVASLSAWKTAVGQDANSFSADPMFLTPNGTSATVDLHVNPSITTVVEGNGLLIASVTDDFDGDVRASFTPTDIGADAGNFTGLDLSPPTITYTALGNTTSTSARTLTATITDVSGVPTSGAGLPVLYWKVNAGSYSSATATSLGSNQYQFSFGSGVNVGDTVSYYVVAQDSASPPNVGANPSAGAGTFTANPPAAGTPPTTPNNYLIQASISGSFTVGSGGNYATITAAVADLNSKVITAPVTFSLTDATYPTETLPITINANSGSSVSNTVTIKPSGTTTVSGSSTTSIFKLNGCSFVTIDGSNNGTSSRDLTISNTSTSTTTGVVWLASASASQGATSNTVKNCIIRGNASTTTLMGVFGGGTSSISTTGNALTTNSSNTISNNLIAKAQYGIFMIGTSTSTLDSGNQVTNNTVGTSTAGDGSSIGGIDLRNQTGATISGNDVQNVVGSGLTNLQGINLQDTKSSTVSANKVHFMNYNGTSTTKTYGITTSTSTFTTVGNASANTYANNFVYDLVTGGTSSLWNLTGINNNGGFGDKYYFNSVNLTGVVAAGSGPSAAFANGNGITSTAATNIDVRNNIFNMVGSSTSTPKLYAHYTTATSYSGSTLNNNDLRSSVTGTATSVLGFFNSTDRADLAAWQTGTGQEANSFSSNPQFVSNTDLHINPSVATIVESNGTPIAGITNDIDGDTRNVTTPDIGADEGTFIAVVVNDVQATAFIDPTNGGSKLVSTAFSPQASFTNNGTASQTNVPVRYRIIGPSPSTAEVYNQTTTIATLNSGATQTATFPSTSISVAGTYTIKARAELGTDTVSANDEITGTMTVEAPLSGGYNVGSGGDFTTLTQAVNKLNNLGVSGPVTISLTDASYSTGETFPLVLNAIPGASSTNTVTIKPASGQSVTITATTTVIKLNGADFVTIDGSNAGTSSRDLTIVDNDTGTASTAVWIASASVSNGATNNTIKNCILSGNASTTTLAGIIAGSGTTIGSAADAANSNNTVQNNQIFRFQNGIFVSGVATGLDQNWSISGNAIGSTVTTDKMGFRGIFFQNGQSFTISNNTVNGVLSSATSSSTMSGIHVSGTLNTGSLLGNIISDIKQVNTGGWGSNGIFLAATSTTSNLTVANNVIYDVASFGFAGTTSSDNGYGIMINSGGGYNLFFNSIRLTTNQTDVTGITAAINISSGVTTSSTLDIRDNVFANTQTIGVRYAIYSGATASVYSNINFNDYYQATGILGNMGGVDQTTITAWRTATGKDVNSFSSDPKFNSTTDLRPQLTSPLLATGTPAGGITTDILGITRSVTTPSVGAYETGADVTGPAISYTLLANTSSTANRTLSPVTITDASGVNTTTGTRPRIYFKKSTDPNALAAANNSANPGWKFVQATGAGGSPFSLNINYAIITGGSVSVGETVQYFVVAQDLASPANVAINSGTFAATPASVALTSTAFPVGGTINSYSVLPSLSGSKTVGASGADYPTLTAAIAALNGSVVSGPVTFTLLDATYPSEVYPLVINTNGGASATNTITIKPAASQNVTLSASTTIFKLNGADFVIIDGSNNGTSSRNLTLVDNDTGTSSAAVWIASASASDGATNNTIKNCIMSGNASTTTLAGIIAGSGTTIGNAADAANSTNTIQNNQITKFQNGMFLNGLATTLDQSWVVTGNSIGSTVSTDKMGFRGILIENAQNSTISSNNINGVTTASTSTASGITVSGTMSGGSILGNIISDIKNTNTGGYGSNGIYLAASSTASNLTVANNVIYDVASYGFEDVTSIDNGYGIMIDSGGGYKLFFNSIRLTTNETDSFAITAAINISSAVTTSSTLDIRDNIFANTQTVGTRYAIYSGAAASVYTNINFNDYYPGTGILGNIGGLDETTITAWRTATGKDANSISTDPQFNSTTNLQPQLGAPVLGAGQPAGAITTDILGVTRSVTTPSMGAYENGADTVGPAITYTPLGNTSSSTARTLTATITDASGVPTSGAGLPVLYWKINAGSYTAATASFIGSNQYQFSFGSGTSGGDTVSYYVVAQDSATPANVSANPSTGAGNFTSSPPAAGTPPTTPNSYTILSTLSGGKTVGTGGDYATVTAAVNALNNSVLTGAVTFTLTDASYGAGETFPIVINANPGSSATNTVTFKPAASQTVAISGSSASSILKINGASFVTIDGSNSGGTDRSLTIANTNTAASTAAVWVASLGTGAGATNNTIKNTVMSAGSNAASANTFGLFVGGTSISTTGTGADNDNLTVQNNAVNTAYYGIYAVGTAATSSGGLDGLIITGNTVGDATAAKYVVWRGMVIGGALAPVVSQNEVLNLVFPSTTSGDPAGIELGSNVANAVVSLNIIHDIENQNSGGYAGRGISISSSTGTSGITIVNNMIYGIRGSGWSSATIDNPYGIHIAGGTNHKVYYNSIYLSGTMSNSSGGNAAGIIVTTSSATGLDIRDNAIRNSFTGSGSPNKAYAFYAVSGTTFGTINYNDYYSDGTGSVAGFLNFLGSDITTLAAWKTATGQDANSISADPSFVSATNVHVSAASSPLANTGTPIAGVTVDFDGNTRNASNPYIGADELVPGISTSGTLSAVDTTYGSASASPTSFSVSGSNLSNNLTVTAPSGFEVSTSLASGYAPSLSLIPSSGGVPSTTIYVRLAATTDVGTYSGNVVCSSAPASSVNVATASSSVSALALTISGLTGTDKTYDRTTTATFGGTPALVGVANGDSIGLGGTPSASFTNFNVGTNKTINVTGYTLTGTKAFDYTLTQPTLTANITPLGLTITGLTGDSKVYDGSAAAIFSGTAALNGVLSGDTANVNLGGTPSAAFATFDVGTNLLVNVSGYTLTGTRAFNYTVTQPALMADITQKTLTITGLTGDDKVYDRTTAANFSGTPSLSGVVSGDIGNVALGGTPSAAFTDFNVGTNKTVNVSGYTLTGSRAFNYALTQPILTADITALGLTITGLTGDSKVYDGTTDATFSGTPSLNGVLPGDTANVHLSGSPTASFADNDAATNKTITVAGYTLTGSRAPNYTLTQPTLTADITQKNLTIAGLTGDDKVYDRTTDATFSGTPSLSGVVAVDSGNVSLGGAATASFSDFDTGTSKTITVSGYTLTGSRASNYTLTQPTLIADITPKALTIAGLTGDDKIYDRTTAATFSGTPSLGGVIAGDTSDVILGGTPTASFADFNVGTNKAISVSGYSLTGTRAFNYTLTQPSLTADIAPKGLTITGLTGDDKIYDRTTAATFSGTPSLNGVIAGDSGHVNLGGTPSASFADFDAGTNKTVTVSGYTLTGTRAFNYTVTQPILTADITPKGLTIAGLTGDDKVYDRTTAATFSGTPSLSGVITGDNGDVNLGGTPTASFGDFNVGTNKTVSVSGYTITGTRAFNYTLTQPILTADITPKGLTITGLTGDDKVYDRTTVATFSGTPSLNGVITGDNGNVALGGTPTAAFGDFNVGTNKAVTVSGYTLTGTRAFNYSVTQPVLSADITPKGLSVTADSGQSKIKGASDPTFTYAQLGLIAPDTITGSLSRITGESPGSYAITLGSLSAGSNYTINFTDAIFVIAGPVAAGDEATRPNGATSFNIPLATLLANDTRIGTDGNSHTDQLSVSAVTSGSGNTVSISGVNVVYQPTNPADTTDKTFTYTLLDAATGATDTGTVTVHTDTNAAMFTLDIVDVPSAASFNGTDTSITVAFESSPNETVTLEYTTNLVTWTAVTGTFNTGTGSFQATITAPGNLAAQWNAGMFFRATN